MHTRCFLCRMRAPVMPERIEKLRSTLAELEAELSELDSLDPASRRRLEEVAAEIDATLRRSDDYANERSHEPASEAAPSVRDQLVENVELFRVQHPTVAGILQRLVDGLAQLGI